jgi:gluconate 2-dehydrogenase gamma chain
VDSETSRRAFLLQAGGSLGSAWIAMHWPEIAQAAHHAEAAPATPTAMRFLSASDAADVDAIAQQIVPSGKTPGAREAKVVYFVDQALTTFFASMAPTFRHGLSDFQQAFKLAHPQSASFASAAAGDQLSFLKSIDKKPFFQSVRLLTVLGLLASPKYGGNYGGLGWKVMGFEDQHAFTPPFGYYDRDYPGFVPYEKEHA